MKPEKNKNQLVRLSQISSMFLEYYDKKKFYNLLRSLLYSLLIIFCFNHCKSLPDVLLGWFCPSGRTALDGTCVDKKIADFVKCTRVKKEEENKTSALIEKKASELANLSFNVQTVQRDVFQDIPPADVTTIINYCKQLSCPDCPPAPIENPAKVIPATIPSIQYKVVKQGTHGCNPGQGSSWDRDGTSDHTSPSAEQIYFFTFNLERQPSGCEVSYIANTDGQRYANGNGWAGNPSKPCFPIQKIKAGLQNCPSNWKLSYRVNTWRDGQNSGEGDWQPWKCDDQWSGIDGRSIIGIQARITTNGGCLQ